MKLQSLVCALAVSLGVALLATGYGGVSFAKQAGDNDVNRSAQLRKLTIPAALRGAWGEGGDCSDSKKRLVVAARAVRFADGKSEAVFYARQDGPQGQDAIHWIEEGVTSNIEYDSSRDVLVMNDMGWGYPATGFYGRCKPK